MLLGCRPWASGLDWARSHLLGSEPRSPCSGERPVGFAGAPPGRRGKPSRRSARRTWRTERRSARAPRPKASRGARKPAALSPIRPCDRVNRDESRPPRRLPWRPAGHGESRRVTEGHGGHSGHRESVARRPAGNGQRTGRTWAVRRTWAGTGRTWAGPAVQITGWPGCNLRTGREARAPSRPLRGPSAARTRPGGPPGGPPRVPPGRRRRRRRRRTERGRTAGLVCAAGGRRMQVG